MTEKTYRQAFEQAKSDLADAERRKQRAAAEVKKAEEESIHLRRAVTALAALCGENIEDSMGLTEAVRLVVGAHWLTFKQIKDQVDRLGVSLADLKNPDASILSVLNRLVAAGEFVVGVSKPVGDDKAPGIKVWKKAASAAPAKPPATNDAPEDDIPF